MNAEGTLSLVEASQLTFLDPARLRFSQHGISLRLTMAEDRSHLRVTVLRAFPLSEPNQYSDGPRPA